MAAPVQGTATIKAGGPDVTFPSSMQINWTQVHTDAEQVNTAGELLNPGSVSSTYVIPAIVSQGTRLRIKARVSLAAAVTTSPVVRIFGADQVPDSSGAFPSGTIFHRIDSENETDAGTTITLAADPVDMMNDGTTYAWSNTLPVSTGWDMLGAKAVIVLVQTAANVNSGTVPLYIALLN